MVFHGLEELYHGDPPGGYGPRSGYHNCYAALLVLILSSCGEYFKAKIGELCRRTKLTLLNFSRGDYKAKSVYTFRNIPTEIIYS